MVSPQQPGAMRALSCISPLCREVMALAITGHHPSLPNALPCRYGGTPLLQRPVGGGGATAPTSLNIPLLLTDDISLFLEMRLPREAGFAAQFLPRMIFSCLTGADRGSNRRIPGPPGRLPDIARRTGHGLPRVLQPPGNHSETKKHLSCSTPPPGLRSCAKMDLRAGSIFPQQV